jgi:hypothetical protein
MTTRKKPESPPSLPDVREQTERLRAATVESADAIAESRRLSKSSRRRMAASLENDRPIEGNHVRLTEPPVKE